MTSSSSPSNAVIVDEYDPALGYHPSVTPLDIRLGLTSSPSRGPKPLRWGILGCSKAAHDFTQALKFLRSVGLPHAVAAVGSRSVDRASGFAARHSVTNAHGSYGALCADATVDVIYVASLHPHHREHAAMALKKGKHVLVEKPMCMTSEDAQYLYDLGRELNLFVGEGMWTRFFPAVEWTRLRLGEAEEGDAEKNGSIGRVRVVQADFSIDGNDVGPYPADSIYARDLGGGSAWCVLPYIVGASTMPFDSAPDRIAANGILPVESDGAGDLAMGMTMTFTHGKKKGAAPREEASTASKNGPPGDRSIASGVCGYLAESSERTTYSAKQGRIIVEAPAHCPTSATILRKSIGRGNGETNDENSGGNHSSSSSSSSSNTNTNTNTNTNISSISSSGTTTVTFPLPQSTPEIDSSGGIKLPNSMGFIYEAEAVRRLIDAKQITFPQWTPEESVGCLRIVEEMLRQVNQ